jgi:hypothetical protein
MSNARVMIDCRGSLPPAYRAGSAFLQGTLTRPGLFLEEHHHG